MIWILSISDFFVEIVGFFAFGDEKICFFLHSQEINAHAFCLFSDSFRINFLFFCHGNDSLALEV